MFEHLDDPQMSTPAPVERVVERGRRLRVHRRMIAGAVAVVVLGGTVATAAALQSGGHKKVVVANESTTTTTTHTVPPNATSTAPPAPTTTTSFVPAVAPLTLQATTTTSTTLPPHDPNDLSMISITWPPESGPGMPPCTGVCDNVLGVPAGTSVPLNYTVTNNGTWTVDVGDCVNNTTELWSTPATSAWEPYTSGIWPQPYPARPASSDVCAGVAHPVPPGASITLTETLLAGYRDAAGNVMPAPPGFTSFRPAFEQMCAQPCATHLPLSLSVTVEPLPWPPPASLYTIDVTTKHVSAASGQSAPVKLTYTNGVGLTVRMPLFGPCWKVTSGTATVDCTGKLPAVIVGPHQTVELTGTVWARSAFSATGRPLAAGRYPLNLGDLESVISTYDANYAYLYVS